ncbi:MAG TPA: hypothetical protein VK625_12170 [Flavitalea sp.]|nr:hypothetical protein [Flavitalea sp.]
MSLVTNIESIIPQRPPFVMISELVYCEGEETRSKFFVEADNIFLKEEKLMEPALVENIAQTAAARAGWLALNENRPVAIGYIGAIQQLEIFDLPVKGDTLDTEIRVMNQVFNVTLISGKLSCKGRLLATCEMKIFISK